MRIAKINPDNTVHYFLADHLGSTRKILDANRNTVFFAEYEPFWNPYALRGQGSTSPRNLDESVEHCEFGRRTAFDPGGDHMTNGERLASGRGKSL